MSEKKNAKQLPRCYYARHIEPGLVGYDEGILFVRNEALKNMNPSFAGKPVYVFHQEVDLQNLEQQMDGVVSESFYNELDGCHYLKFIAISDEAHNAIEQGWSVSNAYMPVLSEDGGVHNNLEYDAEMLKGEYTHLALVPNPRYEQAKIFTPEEYKAYNESKRQALKELQNSKKNKGRDTLIMKFWKKTEVKENVELDTIVQLENGKEVTIGDMIQAVENADKEEKKKEEEKANMDAKVSVGGEDMSVKELVSKYENMCKKNADDESEDDKDELEKKEKEARENAAAEEAKKAELAKKKAEDKKHFDELNNAINKDDEVENSSGYKTVEEKIKLGKERY